MSKKSKKSAAAEDLIESLMDDLKEINSESSYQEVSAEVVDEGNNPWAHLEKGLQADADSVFGNSDYSSEEAEDSYRSTADGEFNDGEASELESPLDFEVPAGFDVMSEVAGLPDLPSLEDEGYQGPSADAGYQSSDDIFSSNLSAADDESTRPVFSSQVSGGEDKTVSIQQDFSGHSSAVAGSDADKTVAVEGFANARVGARKQPDVDVKVSIGNFRGGRGGSNVMTSVDASLAQAESLKLAQNRILELEKEVEVLRSENEELASAGEIIRSRTDELAVRITEIEKEKQEMQESAQSEILILKGNLQYKENEVAKARIKVDELETRLKSDFKKIRVRERELENRLELLRAEKSALVRSKDEYILEQKRKIDQLSQELDNYRKKCLELNKTIEANQDQVKRTERALRLALTNLEAKGENLVPLKKAE